MGYNLLYKCRLCGAICAESSTKTRKVAMKSLLYMCANITPPDPAQEIEMTTMHICDDGNFGVADCLGFRKSALS